MNPVSITATLFTAAVMFGVATMLLKQPKKANALLASGTDTITGITKALEGR